MVFSVTYGFGWKKFPHMQFWLLRYLCFKRSFLSIICVLRIQLPFHAFTTHQHLPVFLVYFQCNIRIWVWHEKSPSHAFMACTTPVFFSFLPVLSFKWCVFRYLSMYSLVINIFQFSRSAFRVACGFGCSMKNLLCMQLWPIRCLCFFSFILVRHSCFAYLVTSSYIHDSSTSSSLPLLFSVLHSGLGVSNSPRVLLWPIWSLCFSRFVLV